MDHLPPSAAIFSPSVARKAASAAKDWNYVDGWLASRFPGRAVPSFERNQETLDALLSLASLNETADEERQLVARAEAAALRDLEADKYAQQSGDGALPPLHTVILDSLENELTRDGRTSLDSLGSLSVDLGLASPTPESLGRALVRLHSQAADQEDMRARVELLASHVEAETARTNELLAELQGSKYAPSPDLARNNLEMQRKIKSAQGKLPETQGRRPTADQAHGPPYPSIQDIAREEAEYSALLSRKQGLDTEMRSFAGLPADADSARAQLEKLRSELQSLTLRRDAVFEGLVDRETPRKRLHKGQSE